MPWVPTLIVFAVLASCAAVVVVGYLRGNQKTRTTRTQASAEPADEPVAVSAPVQPGWDEKAAHTDSWIWR